MADQMFVIITLRKEVPDRETARLVYDLVKQRLADRPDVQVTGLCSNHFDLTQDPPA